MYSAIAVEPTKLTAAMPGCCRIASTASLSPWTTLNTPGGRPASASSSAMRNPAEGSLSDGFRMKQLPQASAIGNIHSGTIAGKLNGVMPAHTPSGWRIDQRVDAAADLLGELALQQMRDAAGELDDLEAAGDLALGVGQHLAVLRGDDAARFVVLARPAARGT